MDSWFDDDRANGRVEDGGVGAGEEASAALRASGLRPIQIWVPDVRLPEIRAEIEPKCKAIANDPHEKEIFDFIDAVMDYSGSKYHGWREPIRSGFAPLFPHGGRA